VRVAAARTIIASIEPRMTVPTTLAIEAPAVRAEPRATPDVATAEARAIVCRRCGHAVTREEARVSRGGAHVHTRINPGGWVFELGCFAEAPGCRAEGPATTAFTWFPGYAWAIALCAGCGTHLGWRYSGEGGTFFGLILDRLIAP
jgi:hypothetical protein